MNKAPVFLKNQYHKANLKVAATANNWLLHSAARDNVYLWVLKSILCWLGWLQYYYVMYGRTESVTSCPEYC